MDNNKRILSTILLTTMILSTTNCELFTALVDMEELLDTESILITSLDDYINDVQMKLDQLRLYHQEYYRKHLIAEDNRQQYLSNPINAYLLVKRLTTDWKHVENLIYDVSDLRNEYPIILNNSEYGNVSFKLPNDEDLSGAAVALIRLQDTYRLDTTSIADGILNGVQFPTELSVDDCFELGRQTYNNADFYHTILWMYEAKNRLHLYEKAEKERNQINGKNITSTNNSGGDVCKKDCTSVTKPSIIHTKYVDILEYLAFSIYMEGNTKVALELTNELLVLNPNHARAKGNLVYYENEINEELKKLNGEKIERKKGEEDESNEGGDDDKKNSIDFFINKEPVTIRERRRPDYNDLPERENYEMLCRNEIKPLPRVLAKLKCRYSTKRHPFTWIAPFKEEDMSLEPLIRVYHQVISDNEIETIKQLAQPRFRRATVQNQKTGALEIATYRISKSAWLHDNEHEHVGNVVQRIEDLTELTQTTAEELQVVNYGIGGHYEPHFDFARKDEINAFKDLGTGNRIATILFYMSDVLQGGATVFPAIKTALWPIKGAAAFWYNLHPSGQGDYLTRHAACPVLSGSKWVANKWIHERGQEFLRPCRLESDPLEPDFNSLQK